MGIEALDIGESEVGMLTVHVCETENRVTIPKREFEKLVRMKSGRERKISVEKIGRRKFSGMLKAIEAREDTALLRLMKDGMQSGDASREDFDKAVAAIK